METVSGSSPAPNAEEGVPISTSIPASDPIPTTAEPPIVQMDGVSKQYRGVNALRGVSFNIQRGEIFGLLGPNGAGKSTLLKLILGFLNADNGTIKMFGSSDLTAAHARIGYLPEQSRYHSNFTGREYMEFQARLAGLSAHDARTVATRALKMVGIEDAAKRRIHTYSKGMRQRLGLAVALSVGGDTPPELLILDEPASGLAPEGQVVVREVLLECKRQGSTILLCSHQLTEVERICSEVGILRGGRLVALTRLHDEARVMIVASPRPRAMEVAPHLLEYLEQLHSLVAIKGGTREDEPLYVSLPTGSGVPHAAAMKAAAIRALVDARWDINSVHIENRDLESIYLRAIRPTKDKAADASPNGRPAEIDTASGVGHKPSMEDTSQAPAGSPAPASMSSLDLLEASAMSDPLPVRSVSSNGPSTTPLPALLEKPDPRTELPQSAHNDVRFNDLRREGEGQ